LELIIYNKKILNMSEYIFVTEFDNKAFFSKSYRDLKEVSKKVDAQCDFYTKYFKQPYSLRSFFEKKSWKGLPIEKNTLYEGNCNYHKLLDYSSVYVYKVTGTAFSYEQFTLERNKGLFPLSAEIIEARAQMDAIPELNFSRIAGVGNIKCFSCGNTEQVTGGLHNPGTNEAILGHQCQNCGTFTTLRLPVNKSQLKCSCGGMLSRDNAVFCTTCKSKQVRYQLQFIS
jgi:hypothetical protein